MLGNRLKEIQIPKIYQPVFENKYNKFLLYGGRLSGKTKMLLYVWFYFSEKYPKNDIVILQSTFADIKDSFINEIRGFIEDSGLIKYYDIPKGCNYIKKLSNIGKTYILPISDSIGKASRTRGKKTINKISLIIGEELQKASCSDMINNAIITFERNMIPDGKILLVCNRMRRGHWINEYIETIGKNPLWKSIYSTYKDISMFLSPNVLETIDIERRYNLPNYQFLYLGDANSNSSEIVFPQFDKSKNYKKRADLDKSPIKIIIIGVDTASTNDKTVAAPIAILANGRAVLLEQMCYDPKANNKVLAPTDISNLLFDHVCFLFRKYDLLIQSISVVYAFDCANQGVLPQYTDLLRTTRIMPEIVRLIRITSFTIKKDKEANLSIIRDCFAKEVIQLLDEGSTTYDFYLKRNVVNEHFMVKEIESQRYTEDGVLDKNIPNDFTDALEYALVTYYINPQNLSLPKRLEYYNKKEENKK